MASCGYIGSDSIDLVFDFRFFVELSNIALRFVATIMLDLISAIQLVLSPDAM
jgi:hypothetical protein